MRECGAVNGQEMSSVIFSVITPVFNRASLLERVYVALQSQTLTDFEWIIVDDGSTEDVRSVVKGWKPNFRVVYEEQQNGGKASAVNAGLLRAQGRYAVVLDSDDVPLPDALRVLAAALDDAPPSICGVGSGTMTSTGQVHGSVPNAPYEDATILDAYAKRGITGDKWFAFRAEWHKRFPFPLVPGEKFVPEALVFVRMSEAGGVVRFINDTLLVHDYLPDGLTRSTNRLRRDYWVGFLRFYAEVLSSNTATLRPYFFRAGANAVRTIVGRARHPVVAGLCLLVGGIVGFIYALVERSRR